MEAIEFDREELKRACFALAKALKWAMGPIDVQKIEELSRAIELRAYDHTLYLAGQQRDPNIVTRAIAYLEHHHAEPHYYDGVGISGMLQVLIELACPNTQPVSASNQFYGDIERGIREARANAVEE